MRINLSIPNNQNSCIKTRQNAHITYPMSKISDVGVMPYYTCGISFTSMKKNQFEGIDSYVVNQFKAPIEKFKTNYDLQTWAGDQCEKIIGFDYEGRTKNTKSQRKSIISEWDNYLKNENREYSNCEKLVILNGITKNLKPDSDNIPPLLNKGVLADTVYAFKNDLKSDKSKSFDFYKTYTNNLRAFYIDDLDTGREDTGWIKISSKQHEPEQFEENVAKLKTLSHKTWCTKSNNAEPYLSKGDFHIYLENGQPKIGVRFNENRIEEIQGEKNNTQIPIAYYDTVISYFAENNFKNFSKTATDEISKAKIKKLQANALRERLKNEIENNDYASIYQAFGISAENNGDGSLTLIEYKLPKAGNLLLTDIGLSEGELFKKVSEVKGDIDLEDSELTSFYNLKKVGGNVNLNLSKLNDFGELEKIEGDLTFNEIWDNPKRAAKVTSLKKIKEIGGELDIIVSNINDLGKLQTVGNDCFLGKSKVKTLKNLENVGGMLDMQKSDIEDTGKLKTVGKGIYLSENLANQDIEWENITKGRIYYPTGEIL